MRKVRERERGGRYIGRGGADGERGEREREGVGEDGAREWEK